MATVELPSFHIECKGTVAKNIPLSILKKWYKQLETDCPKDKIAVLFHFANGIKPFVLAPLESLTKFTKKSISFSIAFQVISGKIFCPKKHLIDDYLATERLAKYLNAPHFGLPEPVAFELSETQYIVAFDAEVFLNYMLNFETATFQPLDFAAAL